MLYGSGWKLGVEEIMEAKIKVFEWRALHDILPTRENLVRRHIVEEDTCELY